MYKLVPLALFTRGEHRVGVHRVLKDPAKRRVRKYCVTLTTADEVGLIALETGVIRKELSITL